MVRGHGEGRQKFQTALFQLQTPFFTGADVVNKALVVVTGDNAQVTDAGGGHIGQMEVDLTVAATERNTADGTLDAQFSHSRIICEDNTHYIHSNFPPLPHFAGQ